MKITFEVNGPADLEELGHVVDVLRGKEEVVVTTEQADLFDSEPTAKPTTPEPVAEPTTPAVPTELDVNGSPWDARIHASTMAKNKDGTWKKRRGVSKEEFDRVTAEITESTTPAPTEAFAAEPVASVTEPAAPAAPAAPATPAAPAALTWDEVFRRVMNAKLAEQINDEQIGNELARLGVEGGFPGLATRNDVWEQFLVTLGI